MSTSETALCFSLSLISCIRFCRQGYDCLTDELELGTSLFLCVPRLPKAGALCSLNASENPGWGRRGRSLLRGKVRSGSALSSGNHIPSFPSCRTTPPAHPPSAPPHTACGTPGLPVSGLPSTQIAPKDCPAGPFTTLRPPLPASLGPLSPGLSVSACYQNCFALGRLGGSVS